MTTLTRTLAYAGLIGMLACAPPASAVDTLDVRSPDPVLEAWRWTEFDRSSGLAGNVLEVFEDREGNIWFATVRGAQCYDGYRWTTYTTEDGLAHRVVTAIIQARDGAMWFGTWGGGIGRFDSSAGSRLTAWTTYTTEDGLIHNRVYDIAQTPDGAIWFGTVAGLSRFDGAGWTEFRLWDEARQQKCTVLYVARDSSLWIGHGSGGTPPRGVTRYDGSTWARYTPENGQDVDQVWDISQTPDGTLWFRGGARLVCFDGARWISYPNEEAPLPFASGSAASSDGAIWLGCGSGEVLRFVPDRRPPETVLEPAAEQVSSAGNILITWQGRDLWDETPPEGMRYQWRLNGGTWASLRGRQHTFTALSDGRYTFEVAAVDRDGNVDPTPAVHAFVVEGPWWKNPWIAGLFALFVAVTGFQATRIVASNRKLHESNVALSSANHELFALNRDLQEKTGELETANRALQREGAVARVRALVQSMEQASDFEGVLSLLAGDLKGVGLHFDTCSIEALEEPVDGPTMGYFEGHGYRYTAYTIDPDGAVVSDSYHISAPFPPVVLETIERFIEGQPWRARTEQNAIVEVPISSYGRLRLTASDREAFAEADVDALRDFASAIGLGYSRYLDFQQLEDWNRALAAANREIQEQTERKSAFLASMSHELRTPMNAIIGFTRMALRRAGDVLPDRQKENLNRVVQSAHNLLALINDILDLSKIEAGRMDVNAGAFDAGKLIVGCCAEVEPLVLEKPDVKLTCEVADDVGETITDAGRLRQILMNLLSNAIKFTEKGEVAVRASKADGQLVVTVSDTGAGIPADALETIFEEFQQVKGSDPQHKGTGLGLPICRGFAELLGGAIHVESEVGKGSTFTVRVPAIYRQGIGD